MGKKRFMLSLAVAAMLAAVSLSSGPIASAETSSSELPAAAFEPIGQPVSPPTIESQVNVTGDPFTGTNPDGTVRGYADIHTHIFSNLAFGGHLLCGEPFNANGVAAALTDCESHKVGKGAFALFDMATNAYGATSHDPVGWPTFNYWPSWGTITHQQMYYKWIERSWRAGQRVLVNELVQNAFLCSLDAAHEGPCDDMYAVKLQAKQTYALQAYIDAQYGGPGKGWFRVVTNSTDARRVITAGKLAVILAVEGSAPFGCSLAAGIAQCSEADIDRGLDTLKNLGIQSTFLCHKYDNALCGVRMDEDGAGTAVQIGQFFTSGTAWDTEACPGPAYDNPVAGSKTPACNVRGLTDLGEYALRGLIKRNMMVEIDHMSVKAAERALQILEHYNYPGVISGHSWMDVNFNQRLFNVGGFLALYPFDPKTFVQLSTASAPLRDAAGIVGIGLGVDANGLGNRFAPTKTSDGQPAVTYPVKAPVGDAILQPQASGERTWDYNKDAIAHYGMIPDWLTAVEAAGGQRLAKDIALGAEGYLRTWAKTSSYRQPDTTNLALGKPVKVSSTMALHKENSGDKAVDGKLDTRWESVWADSQWMTVDLGAVKDVRRVEIAWEYAYAKSYKLIGSDDGVNWHAIQVIGSSDGGRDLILLSGVKTRYIGLGLDKRGTGFGFSIKEFQVIG